MELILAFIAGVLVTISAALWKLVNSSLRHPNPVSYPPVAAEEAEAWESGTIQPGLQHPNEETMAQYHEERMTQERIARRNPYEPADWKAIGKQE